MSLAPRPGWLTRGAAMALFLLALLAGERWQRAALLPAQAQAQATGPISPGVAGAALPALQQVAAGHIPMPEGALAAHASSLLAMPADSAALLTAFWFAGDRESAPNVQIAAAQFDRASRSWSAARFVVNRHLMERQLGFGLRRLGNPVPWLDADGRMHLFVVATGWGGWAAARILHLVQDSPGNALAQLHFSPVRVLPLSWLWNTSFLVRNNPLPLADGGMVLPVHFEIGMKYPALVRFDGQGGFSGLERISRRPHLLQPTLLARDPQHWLALMRDHSEHGHIGVAETRDGGVHWDDLPDLDLVNPDAAVHALTLASGQHLLVHNSSPHSRAVLDLSASSDGLHWQTLSSLAQGSGADEYSYPGLAWAEGSLWVSFTDHRKRIAWQQWRPAAAGGGAP